MYYCGIDVAKRKHAIALLDDHGQPVHRPFTIDNTRAGFDQLWQALASLSGPVLIGLEATGHYWWALYEELTQHDHPVVVLNALQVHAFRKSGVRKVKSDRTDATWIAEFLRFSQPAPAQPTTPVLLQLKEVTGGKITIALGLNSMDEANAASRDAAPDRTLEILDLCDELKIDRHVISSWTRCVPCGSSLLDWLDSWTTQRSMDIYGGLV